MKPEIKWSRWFDHTPGPCPVPAGTTVQVVLENLDELSPMPAVDVDWHCPGDDVTRYRYRISTAFEDIRKLAENPADMVVA
jgi:hypothetical protein